MHSCEKLYLNTGFLDMSTLAHTAVIDCTYDKCLLVYNRSFPYLYDFPAHITVQILEIQIAIRVEGSTVAVAIV